MYSLLFAAVSAGNDRVFAAKASFLVCALCLIVACDNATEPRLPVSQLVLSQPCDLRQGCQAADASMAVTVTLDEGARALQPFPIHIQLTGGRRVNAVTVAFSMQGMDMGANRYRLTADGAGDITLPICTSGRTDWLADFDFVAADKRVQLQMPFVLQK